ncbi:MAG: hypothetical protein JWN90_81 [Parcubacteria group bacterium]|nr:hypothetical protein [Parcubacteria group bacterium]
MDYTQDGEKIPERRKSRRIGLKTFGVMLILLAIILIVRNIIDANVIRYTWPVILAVAGVAAVFRSIWTNN